MTGILEDMFLREMAVIKLCNGGRYGYVSTIEERSDGWNHSLVPGLISIPCEC